MSPRTLPDDGSPLVPSPVLRQWREEGPATPLTFADGHEGVVVTSAALARAVLEDTRFRLQPQRFPLPTPRPLDVDDRARAGLETAALLSIDGPQHARLRRMLTKRLSVRSVQTKRETVARIVSDQLAHLLGRGTSADLLDDYAEPIATAVHRHVLGIPDSFAADYEEVFVRSTEEQPQFDLVRDILAAKAEDPGEDVLSDLVAAELLPHELDAQAFTVMSSGRDMVAKTITVSVVALLLHPDQLALVRADPTVLERGVEELLRFSSSFLTLFPRTPVEDVELLGVRFPAGRTVAPSAIGANRDASAYPDPDVLDLDRDALGHLTFSHGRHSCAGQQLARVEVREAVTQLVTRMPALRLVSTDLLGPAPFFHAVGALEVGVTRVAWDDAAAAG